jgi:hypothetical protein
MIYPAELTVADERNTISLRQLPAEIRAVHPQHGPHDALIAQEIEASIRPCHFALHFTA